MRISVLGAGAWGTALAASLASRHDTVLWVRDADQAAHLAANRCNRRYLPDHPLPATLSVTADLHRAVAHARGQLLILAVPTAGMRPMLRQLQQLGYQGNCAWLSKGLERDSGLLVHQIAAEELPQVPSGPLSGPSFAQEVASGLPTALVAAGAPSFCEIVTAGVHSAVLRVYSTDDVVGVEVGGAVKNVIAIGAGMADAMQFGMNARAALLTRGLHEIRRLGEAMGARAETFTGLTGMGDLILTCTGDLSRNRQVGLALGRGIALNDAIASLGHVAEGVWSARAVQQRARQLGVEMPITHAICDVLDGNISARESAARLMARDPRTEHH
jgi:glycerol-3-phosphate dehydrogenase (NAD(P)+)